MAEGIYRYEAVSHRLIPLASGDFRIKGNWFNLVSAPVVIFYIVDLSKYDTGPGQPDPYMREPETQKSYFYTDTGMIAQNVYLFAASQGLAAWFHNCHKEEDILKAFKLHANQRILFAQSVGFPGKR